MPLAHPSRTVAATLAVAAGVAGLTAAPAFGAFASGTAPLKSGPPVTRHLDDDAGVQVGATESCDQLLAWYVGRGVSEVGPYGWGGDGLPVDYAASAEGRDAAASGPGLAPVPAAAPSTVRQVNGDTGTNVQEADVDEPDTAKTDGHTLYTVEDGSLVVYDVEGAAVTRLAGLSLLAVQSPELLLDGDTVLAVGAAPNGQPGTALLQVDVSDRGHPVVAHTFAYDADLVAARLIGGTTRLVLRSDPPQLAFQNPTKRTSAKDATTINQALVRATTLTDWLPSVSEDGGDPRPLLGCDQVALPHTDGDLGTVTVVGFTAADPAATSTTGLAVSTDLAYVSASKLYLAASSRSYGLVTPGPGVIEEPGAFAPQPRSEPFGDDGSTRLYAFDLDGQAAGFVASGTVDGAVRDRWAMDEYDGVLRLAVTPTSRTGDFASVVTMRQEGDALVEDGRVDRLGVGEQLESVRWFDQLAIVVTYRQVDPLFAIDLTDAAHPRLMGQLSLPGYSAYLHPLGSHRLLGLGQTGNGWEAEAGLFDVTDLVRPRLLDQVAYGPNTQALATSDPRQLTWLPDRRTVLSVIEQDGSAGAVGYVSALHLADGHLTNAMTRVEYGDEVGQVRLVPLPDGRVVLVTGDGARFFTV